VEYKLLRYWEGLKNVPFCIGFLLLSILAAGSEYKAGVARIDITPSVPIRMAGYAARENPSKAVAGHLWVKALAIEDRKE